MSSILAWFIVLRRVRIGGAGGRCSSMGKILPFRDRITPVSLVPAKKNELSFGKRSVPSKAWQSEMLFLVIKNLCRILSDKSRVRRISPSRESFWSFAARTLVFVFNILCLGTKAFPFCVSMLTDAPLSNRTLIFMFSIDIKKRGKKKVSYGFR